MREKIMEILERYAEDFTIRLSNPDNMFPIMGIDEAIDEVHKEYMAWFREGIEELKILSDEEILVKAIDLGIIMLGTKDEAMGALKEHLGAQLDDIKRQLKEMMK